jgi:MFS family permease
MGVADSIRDETNWRNVIAAAAAISVFGFALGQMFPLLSLILEARGYSDDMIGLNAAMSPIGILVSSPLIPLAARRFGTRNTALAAAFATALVILSYNAFPWIEAWFVLRFLQGMAISTLFVLSEAWIVKYAAGGQRGRIVAAYASVLSASFAAGPAVIGWLGIEGWTPFLIGAGVMIAAMAPLSLVRDDLEARPEGGKSSFLKFAPKAPVLLAAVGMFAIFDAATLSLIPVYGVRLGLDLTTAASTLTALIIGNVLLQMPIGWLADRYPKRAVMGVCALSTAALLLLTPVTMATIWMWPMLIVLGATGYAIYTVALAELGDRFQGQELVQGSAAFATMWGSGALLGSVMGGWAMAAFGPHGLPLDQLRFPPCARVMPPAWRSCSQAPCAGASAGSLYA